jgi:hypothetical protein
LRPGPLDRAEQRSFSGSVQTRLSRLGPPTKSNRSHEFAAIHKVIERAFKKIRKPYPRSVDPLHALQLCQISSDYSLFPAMAADVSKTLWSIRDIVNLLDTEYAKPVITED